MENKSRLLIVSVIMLLTLAGCQMFQAETPAPTVTPQPVKIGTPIGGNTPTTALDAPAATQVPALPVILTSDIYIDGSYFLVRMPDTYKTKAAANDVRSERADKLASIALLSNVDSQNRTSEQILDNILKSLFPGSKDSFDSNFRGTVIINGREVVDYDIQGVNRQKLFHGRAVLAELEDHRYVAVYALALVTDETDAWLGGADREFAAVIKSVEFINPKQEKPSFCEVSADETYGYTPENPIQVGGNEGSGPQRAQSYLKNLTGPNGERLTYRQADPLIDGERMLDVYVLSGLTDDLTLYVDNYSFSAPYAPKGLYCYADFSLQAP
jgi:hypothetical protein